MRNHILKAQKLKRSEFLFRDKSGMPPPSLVLNITYHAAYLKLKGILSNIHFLLTSNEEHHQIFQDMVRFKNGKIMKDVLMYAKLPTQVKSGFGRK